MDIARLQETHEEELHQKDAQLEHYTVTIQQLNAQLRNVSEHSRLREDQLAEELQQKTIELQQRNAAIVNLQQQLQVCSCTGRSKNQRDWDWGQGGGFGWVGDLCRRT